MSVRPIPMRTTMATSLLTLPLALGLAGCGSQQGAGSADTPSSEAPAAAAWGGCTAAAFAEADGDLQQVGADPAVSVKLPDAGPCAGGLVVRTQDDVAGLDVSGLGLDPATAQPIHLGDGPTPVVLLRVDGGRHPRGGFQPHVFRLGEEVAEVTVDGNPLVPFIATDGGMAPMTVRCGDDGTLQVLSSTTSEPPGIVLAWDVEQTSYDVAQPAARLLGHEQVRDHAADPLLRDEMPALFDPEALFAGC